MLTKISEQQPDMRFGKLVAGLALFARGPFVSATYDVKDVEFLEVACRHFSNLEKRREAKKEVAQLTAAMKQKAAA